MGSKVGQLITSWVYVDGGAAATVAYAIYDENGDLFASGNMTHKGGARFYANWTPDAIGIWTGLFTCSTPSFSALLSYHAGMGQEADILTNLATVDGYVSGIKGGGWTTETLKAIYDALPGGGGGGIFGWKTYQDVAYVTVTTFTQNVYKELFSLTGGAKLISLDFQHNNDENAPKSCDLKLEIDNWDIETVGTPELPEGVERDFYLKKSTWDTFIIGGIGGSADQPIAMQNENNDMSVSEFVTEGHQIDFNVRFVDAPGTNQNFQYKRVYQVLEAV